MHNVGPEVVTPPDPLSEMCCLMWPLHFGISQGYDTLTQVCHPQKIYLKDGFPKLMLGRGNFASENTCDLFRVECAFLAAAKPQSLHDNHHSDKRIRRIAVTAKERTTNHKWNDLLIYYMNIPRSRICVNGMGLNGSNLALDIIFRAMLTKEYN